MIEEQGIVIENLDHAAARVKVTQSSACHSCACAKVCYSFTGKTERVIEAKNLLDAKAGQPVVIGIREKALLSASFWLYMIPLAGIFSGVILIKLLVPSLEEEWVAAAALLGLVLGYGAVHWHSKHLREEDYRPVILRLGELPIHPDYS